MSKILPTWPRFLPISMLTSTTTSSCCRNGLQQPSISNSGEGIPESAEMVKGFFDKLGCQQPGLRRRNHGIWHAGNPVVFAKCDEGAPKTLVIYWKYDTMPDHGTECMGRAPVRGTNCRWRDGGAVPALQKVLIGRGAVQLQGPGDGQFNAFCP